MSEDPAGEPDGIDWERLGRLATEPDGSFHWSRIGRAIRGRGSREDPNLTLPLVAATLATLVGSLLSAIGWSQPGIEPLWIAGLGLVVVLSLAAAVFDRIDDYYADDAEVVVEELRYRYAAGALSFEAFESRIERVLQDGPDAVEAGPEPRPGAEVAPDTTDDRRDAVALLRERYARGDIDEAEYRQRMDVLGEAAPGGRSTETWDGERSSRESDTESGRTG